MNLTVLPSTFDAETRCTGCGEIPQLVLDDVGRQLARLCVECAVELQQRLANAVMAQAEFYVRLPACHDDVRNAFAIDVEQLAAPVPLINPPKRRRKRKR